MREGIKIASESKRREVLQLLRDHQSWHAAFGGAVPTDEGYLRSAGYTSGGLILRGSQFRPRDRPRLAKSFDDLEHALAMLRIESHDLYITLRLVYLSDAADPSRITDWREKADRGSDDARGAVRLHDMAVDRLAELLSRRELYVVFPSRMTSQHEKQIERRNDEFFATYRRMREDGTKKTEAVSNAALICGYGLTRAWEIVGLREGSRRRLA